MTDKNLRTNTEEVADALDSVDEPNLDLGALMEDGILGELSESDVQEELHEPGEDIVPTHREEVGYVPQVGVVPVKRHEGKVTYLVPSRDDAVLNRDVFRLVRDLKLALDKLSVPVCKEWGVTHGQYEAMKELDLDPGLSATELARRLNLQRSNVASLCKRLAEKGYLVISPNREDRRGITLTLTEEGRDIVAGVEGDLMAAFDMSLSASRRETFEKIIVGMTAARELLAEMKTVRL